MHKREDMSELLQLIHYLGHNAKFNKDKNLLSFLLRTSYIPPLLTLLQVNGASIIFCIIRLYIPVYILNVGRAYCIASCSQLFALTLKSQRHVAN